VLGEGGESLQEVGLALGQLLKDLYQDISSVPCLPPLAVQLVPGSFRNGGSGASLGMPSWLLRDGYGDCHVDRGGLLTQEGGDRLGVWLEPAEVLDLVRKQLHE
jgi:hypothetical protein